MTPEEKAVIDAAIRWLNERTISWDPPESERFLVGAIQVLMFTWPEIWGSSERNSNDT